MARECVPCEVIIREQFLSYCKTNKAHLCFYFHFSSTPVLLGQKVVMRYFRGKGYLEMDVHVGSSAIADNIVGVCRSYGKAFICNLGELSFFFSLLCGVLLILLLVCTQR